MADFFLTDQKETKKSLGERPPVSRGHPIECTHINPARRSLNCGPLPCAAALAASLQITAAIGVCTLPLQLRQRVKKRADPPAVRSHQVNSAPAQVRPPPKPTVSTRIPVFSTPAWDNSSRAKGMLAAEVLP